MCSISKQHYCKRPLHLHYLRVVEEKFPHVKRDKRNQSCCNHTLSNPDSIITRNGTYSFPPICCREEKRGRRWRSRRGYNSCTILIFRRPNYTLCNNKIK